MALDVGASDDHTTRAPGSGASAGGHPTRAAVRGRHARWLLPLVLVLFAGVLRFTWLSHPERIYFDETYYADNARQLLAFGVEADLRVSTDPDRGVEPDFVVHPPVGKWLIATGIAVFGDNSFGWRFGAAAAGTALVGVTYFLGLRLFRRRGIAALAAFLLAIEGLALTMSRISMLDIFLALFVALGVWALLIDRDQRWAAAHRLLVAWHGAAHDGTAHDESEGHQTAGDETPDSETAGDQTAGGRSVWAANGAGTLPAWPARLARTSRPYLWLAGVAFGLAVATKWSALLAIGGAGLYLLGSELAWRRAVTGRWHRQLPQLAFVGLAALVAVPAVVYVASYGAWFANYERTRPGTTDCPTQPCDAGVVQMAQGWWGEQQEIYRFHRTLEEEHNYRASAALWPLTQRPVVYYYESCPDGDPSAEPCDVPPGEVEEILGLGNPAIWWLAIPVYPWLLWAAVRRRDRAAAAIAVFLLAQYVPWLVQPRTPFFFYALPLVPFVVLALAWGARELQRLRALRWLPIAAAALAVAAFVFWAPVYYGAQISEEAWRMRMWLQSWI